MLWQFVRKSTLLQFFGLVALLCFATAFGVSALMVGLTMESTSEHMKFEKRVNERHKDEWKRFGVRDNVSPTNSIELLRLLKENPEANWVAFYGGGVDDNSVAVAVNNVKDLRILSALDTNIGDAGLEHLKDCVELRRITFGGRCGVTDKGLVHLQRLTKLEELGLGDAAITDEGLRLLKPLVSLKALHLGSNFIKGEGLLHLAELPNLLELSLHGSGITNDSLKHLKHLKKLERINLYRTGVTDEGLKHLAACPNLKEVFLSHTAITDAGVKELGKLKQLELLDVRDTVVSEETVRELTRELPSVLVRRGRWTSENEWVGRLAELGAVLLLISASFGCCWLAILYIRKSAYSKAEGAERSW